MSCLTKTLPTEVWLDIFNRIDSTKMLAQCRLVCRCWKPLVEKIMYKMVNRADDTRLAKLCEHLVVKPELGRLIQTIHLRGNQVTVPALSKFLQLTPDLKIIDAELDRQLMDELFSRPEFLTLKLEQLPSTEFSESYLKCLLHYKQTLRSATINFNILTYSNSRICLCESLDQLKHLQHLAIKDQSCFKNIRDLDHVLRKCNQIQQLTIRIHQDENYIHTRKTQLDQWLTDSVQRVETITSLKIAFMDDSLDDEEKGPYEYGLDWMDYLAHKCPNVTKLTVYCDMYNRRHIILPRFTHMETFDLKNWIFYDLDALKHFVDMLATQSVYIIYAVGFHINYGDPYLCSISAIKKRPTDHTTFSITIPHEYSTKADTTSIISIFAARAIKRLIIDLSECHGLKLFNGVKKCNLLNVESFILTTQKMLFEECLQQPIFTKLHQLEIVDTTFGCNFMKQVNTYSPSLTRLKLTNCSVEDKVLLPSIQLTSLSLHKNKFGDDRLTSQGYTTLLFGLSTTKCPKEQLFLAAPNKPLQRVTKQEADLLAEKFAVYIECGSLEHLSVDLADLKFEMTFHDDTNLVKAADCGI